MKEVDELTFARSLPRSGGTVSEKDNADELIDSYYSYKGVLIGKIIRRLVQGKIQEKFYITKSEK